MNNMGNIGIFTHDLYPFKPWGQGRYVYDLVRHLRKNWPERIYTFSPSDGIRDGRHIRIFPGSHDSLGKNIAFSVKLGFRIEELIRTYNLSLVHFQGGPGGLFLIKKPSVPVIYTAHHTYYQQARYLPDQKWKKLLYHWENFSYHLADYMLCDSNSTRRVVLRHYNHSPDKCETIPVGVDRSSFFPLNVTRIPNSLFFLGRLEARKGIDFLVRAMVSVKRQLRDVQLYIGGEGVLRPQLENFVRQNNLVHNVHFIGALDDADLNKWYNQVSIVVIPSVFEGFGLTAIEAMACGTPVVATDVDALRDVIEDGETGFLAPFNDIEALSSQILRLLGNEAERTRFAARGLERVESIYNWDTISQEVLNRYKHFIV